jgi:hypothetical protein
MRGTNGGLASGCPIQIVRMAGGYSRNWQIFLVFSWYEFFGREARKRGL